MGERMAVETLEEFVSLLEELRAYQARMEAHVALHQYEALEPERHAAFLRSKVQVDAAERNLRAFAFELRGQMVSLRQAVREAPAFLEDLEMIKRTREVN